MFFASFAVTSLADDRADNAADLRNQSHTTDSDNVEDEESARARIQWTEIGQVDNMMIAGLAKEMLESEGIPVVVMSQSGFLGELGLPLQNMFTGQPIRTRLLVPSESADEATSLMFETMGEMWYPSDQSTTPTPNQESAE